jgi:tRNA U34 5-carboxymethylaminomethyl modifying enzyme MnmG/GidA
LLTRHRPDTIAQANRLPGMTPAAVLAVLRYLKSAKAGIDSKSAATGG